MPTETIPDLTLVDDVDDVDAHAVYCQCDDCNADRRHDQLDAA